MAPVTAGGRNENPAGVALMRRLTEQNVLVLRAIAEIQKESSFPPTVREIAAWTMLSSTATVQYHLTKLTQLGLVARKGSRRAITSDGFSVLNGGRLVA